MNEPKPKTRKPEAPPVRTVELPSVFAFLDHRDYLREWFEAKRALTRTFSYRVFARKAGFASHAFLSEVIQGRRNLSEDSVDKCVHALGLANEAIRYFHALVRYGQETHLDKRPDLLAELLRQQASQAVQRVGRSQSSYFSSWILPTLREVAVFGNFGQNFQAMADFFQPKVRPEEIQEGLTLLLELGLLQKDSNDCYQYSCPRLTPGDVDIATVRVLKRQMILLAADRLEAPESPDTHLSSVTISVSHARLGRIREILDRTRRELLAETATDEDPADQVLQVNLQMIPLTTSLERYRSSHG